jgi:hypothetical protein
MRSEAASRFAALRGAAAVLLTLLALAAPGCGGVSVSPTGPSTAKESVLQGTPTLLNFHGTLQDGGSFNGYIVYGSRDLEGRSGFGRYQGAFWDVTVTGGSTTSDAHFSSVIGGRALLEAYAPFVRSDSPFPIIGLVFLWPVLDPSEQGLTPHFRASPDYNPDLGPPSPEDFLDLLPGSFVESFGIYRDGQGRRTLVDAAQIAPTVHAPDQRLTH